MKDLGCFRENVKGVFFCGIGGASMLGLAMYLKKCGYGVQGSDASPRQETVLACRESGIPLFFSHDADNVIGCDVFVYTAAISADNPELRKAKELGLKTLTRSQLMGQITGEFPMSIGVSGTHGKSTVTNMIYSIFAESGKKPTLFAGAPSVKTGSSMVAGDDKAVIYEACEYSRSFLDMPPSCAVVLNIEREHTDIYPTLSDAENAFFEFARKSKTAVLNYDNPSCTKLALRLNEHGTQVQFFSLDRTRSALFSENLREARGFYTFDIFYQNELFIKDMTLAVPGLHNVSNALAAILTATACGITSPESIKRGIESYVGIKRRLEYIGSINGADVYDDYAHHPTEIRATLEAVKKLGYDKIVCAFQPHTYSRTAAFFDDFTKVFDACDEVLFVDIYAARERNIYGIHSKLLADSVKNGKYFKDNISLLSYLRHSAHPKTLILTMGAGELDKIARALCESKG